MYVTYENGRVRWGDVLSSDGYEVVFLLYIVGRLTVIESCRAVATRTLRLRSEAKLRRSKSRWRTRARAARTRSLPASIPSTSTSACMAGRHFFVFFFFSLLLFVRFVFVCRPLYMSNSLRDTSWGLYFSLDFPCLMFSCFFGFYFV
jgi:hypothetical protein